VLSPHLLLARCADWQPPTLISTRPPTFFLIPTTHSKSTHHTHQNSSHYIHSKSNSTMQTYDCNSGVYLPQHITINSNGSRSYGNSNGYRGGEHATSSRHPHTSNGCYGGAYATSRHYNGDLRTQAPSMASKKITNGQCRLLSLPPEIRNRIYQHAFSHSRGVQFLYPSLAEASNSSPDQLARLYGTQNLEPWKGLKLVLPTTRNTAIPMDSFNDALEDSVQRPILIDAREKGVMQEFNQLKFACWQLYRETGGLEIKYNDLVIQQHHVDDDALHHQYWTFTRHLGEKLTWLNGAMVKFDKTDGRRVYGPYWEDKSHSRCVEGMPADWIVPLARALGLLTASAVGDEELGDLREAVRQRMQERRLRNVDMRLVGQEWVVRGI
jgi:hypothetical protein